MKVEQKGHTTIIKDTESNCIQFLDKLTANYNSYKSTNLILDVTHDKSVTLEYLKEFNEINKQHKKNKKSLVIVADGIDFNNAPSSLHIVPSLLEAHDVIEMEEIERDLGF